MKAIKRLWIKCLTDRRYAHVTETVVWLTMGLLLGAFVLGVSGTWESEYPSVTPIPTPTEIPK